LTAGPKRNSKSIKEQNVLATGGQVPGTAAGKGVDLWSEDTEEFGEFLFGDERGLSEPNTEEEQKLGSDLHRHYHGMMSQLSRWVPKLVDLERQGEYADFLSVPDHYQYAYRALSLSDQDMHTIFGNKFKEETGGSHVISGKFRLPGKYDTREHFSWTVSVGAMRELADDWQTLHIRGTGRPWLVMVRAPISENHFLLNPDETEPFADEFSYQKEVISVGEVVCDRAIYAYGEAEGRNGLRANDNERHALQNLAKIRKENHEGLADKKIVKITCGKKMDRVSLEAIKDFIRFCQGKLEIDSFPHFHLHAVKQPNMTTGAYMMQDNTIHVLVGNRLVMDVLRTIAHELTHRKQHESGVLDRELAKQDPMDEMGDLNTVYENEAYEKSGNFVKEFARRYKKISKDELFSLNESKNPALSADSKSRVAAAIQNSGEESIQKTLNMRNGKGLGSQFLHPQTMEDLLNANWQPLTEGAEHVRPGCSAFMAPIPGVLGAAPISMFADDTKAVLQASMHRPDLAELLAPMPNGLPKVKFTTIILGDAGGKEVVYTFHPGAPSPMGEPVTIESVQRKFNTDSPAVPVTIGIAKKLGFLNVKNIDKLPEPTAAISENVLDKMGKKKVAKSLRKGSVTGPVYTEFPSGKEKAIVTKVSKNLHREPYSHNPPMMGLVKEFIQALLAEDEQETK